MLQTGPTADCFRRGLVCQPLPPEGAPRQSLIPTGDGSLLVLIRNLGDTKLQVRRPDPVQAPSSVLQTASLKEMRVSADSRAAPVPDVSVPGGRVEEGAFEAVDSEDLAGAYVTEEWRVFFFGTVQIRAGFLIMEE